jgi:hypothetical protein
MPTVSVSQDVDNAGATDSDSRSSFLPPVSTDSTNHANLALTSQPHIWMTHLLPNVLNNNATECLVCALPITDNTLQRNEDCYHDSGANRHVFNRCNVFIDYSKIAPVKIHGFGEGLAAAVIGKGTVKLIGTYKGSSNIYTLSHCLHVPDAYVNLISQVRLNKSGISAWFENGKVTLFKDRPSLH